MKDAYRERVSYLHHGECGGRASSIRMDGEAADALFFCQYADLKEIPLDLTQIVMKEEKRGELVDGWDGWEPRGLRKEKEFGWMSE